MGVGPEEMVADPEKQLHKNAPDILDLDLVGGGGQADEQREFMQTLQK